MAHRPVAKSHGLVRHLHECKKKLPKKIERWYRDLEKEKNKEIKQSRRNTSIRVFILVPVRRARILFMSCTLSLPISAIFVRVFLSRMGKHRTYGNTCIVFHPTDRSTHPFHSPFSYPNTYPILPFERVITSFSEDRPSDHFRSTVLELIG